MKSNLFISLFTLGVAGIGSLGTATADVRWRYPYKSAPYGVLHSHATKDMHIDTSAWRSHHHVRKQNLLGSSVPAVWLWLSGSTKR